MTMSLAFDPFAINGDEKKKVSDVNNESSFTADFSQLDGETGKLNDSTSISFEPFSLDFSGISASVQERNNINTDIFSSLFTTNNKLGIDKNSTPETSFLSVSSGSRKQPEVHQDIPIHVALHEELSCVYDMSAKSASMSIDGAINVEFNPELEGRSFFLSLQDPNNHIGDLTSFFDYATELKASSEGADDNAFVQKEQSRGHRVFRIDLPVNIDAKLVNIIKYTGSEFLRPIPLLVNSKAQVASKYCRVRIKIRSNPSNEERIKNLVVLVAVPPNIDGESMKMSISGGIWDPMKRLISFTECELISGETMEVQLQFEILSSDGVPKFPILVRCDGEKDQLSDIVIRLGQQTKEGVLESKCLVVSKSYRLFHRKV